MFKFTFKPILIPLSLFSLSLFYPLNLAAIASEKPLTGTSWKLVSWGTSPSSEPPLAQTQITLRFGEKQVNGSSGCNRYMASYQLATNQLKIAATAATRMACQREVMMQERQYLSALQGSQSYEINSQGQLQIRYQGNQNSGILIFERNP